MRDHLRNRRKYLYIIYLIRRGGWRQVTALGPWQPQPVPLAFLSHLHPENVPNQNPGEVDFSALNVRVGGLRAAGLQEVPQRCELVTCSCPFPGASLVGAALPGKAVHPDLNQGGPRPPGLEWNQPPLSTHPHSLGCSPTTNTDYIAITPMSPFSKCPIHGVTQYVAF